MYKRKGTGILGIAITIIILILLVFLSNVSIENLSYIETIATNLVMPVQNGLTYMKNKIAGNNTFFSDINNLKAENEELKQKNKELDESIRELEIIKAENKDLKEQLNLTEKYKEYETVSAGVINRDITNYSSVFVINVGKVDGIEVDMPVISDKGLVGHIISVDQNTSKVQTIVDSSSTITALISTSRDAIICKGTLEGKGILKATYIPTEVTLVGGDLVETSGIGGIYPKGIQIGKISKIVNTKNVTDRYALIETTVDFDKLETVLVIK